MSPFIAACKNAQHADIIQAFLDYKRTDVTVSICNIVRIFSLNFLTCLLLGREMGRNLMF